MYTVKIFISVLSSICPSFPIPLGVTFISFLYILPAFIKNTKKYKYYFFSPIIIIH